MAYTLWCGYFTPGGVARTASSGHLENLSFCKDLWRVIVKAESSSGGEESKRAVLLAERVAEKKLTVLDALIQYVDVSLLHEVYKEKVFRYALVGFQKKNLMQTVSNARWPAMRRDATFTVSRVQRCPVVCSPQYPRNASGHHKHSAPRLIYEVPRPEHAYPDPGMFKTISNIFEKFLDMTSTPCGTDLELGKQPVFSLCKYLERLYLYTGFDSYSRIIVAMIYLERLLGSDTEKVFTKTKRPRPAPATTDKPTTTKTPPKGVEEELRGMLQKIHTGTDKNDIEPEGWEKSKLREEYERLARKECPKNLKAGKLYKYYTRAYWEGTNYKAVFTDDTAFDAEAGLVRYCPPKQNRTVVFTRQTAHKVIAGLVCIATKQHDDAVRRTSHLAAICGFTKQELIRIEHRFLSLLSFELWIDPVFYTSYEMSVRVAHREYSETVLKPAFLREWNLVAVRDRYSRRAAETYLTISDFIDFGKTLESIDLDTVEEEEYGEGEEEIVRLVKRKLGPGFIEGCGFMTIEELKADVVRTSTALQKDLHAFWEKTWRSYTASKKGVVPQEHIQEFRSFVARAVTDQISPLHYAECLSVESRRDITPLLGSRLSSFIFPHPPTLRNVAQPVLVNYKHTDHYG
eukprot:TRINITY_DN2250_c0_g1_i5.p1 TRINITY_DN2250_c0_g1~~TRINITY_DN2250_c0_g1_i5.p1  ORF type:complete len:630 (+),score=110.57 TRINITY_DN2250_c0_g1_i5:315-2204(+)